MTDHWELHDELRSVARELLAKENTDWSLLGQAGWIGLEAPEACGGGGASFAETAVILGEIGHAAAATPYLGSSVLAIGILNALQPDSVRDEALNRAITGETRIAVALPTDGGTSPEFRFDGERVWGRADFVPDAAGAGELLLLARDADGDPLIVSAPAGALVVTARPVLDGTRSLAEIRADVVAVETSAVLRFEGDPQAGVRRLFDRACLAVACDSLGLSEAMLAATVAYVGVRHQFGRAVGSFQAVKHACADMLVQLSVGRRLVEAAIEAVTAQAPGATTAVLMAKAAVCDAAVDIAGKAMQLHGGIGYTWENGIHVYLKRATLNRSLFGTPEAHRRQLALRYL